MNRPEAPGWARFSSTPSVQAAEYSAPIRSAHCSPGLRRSANSSLHSSLVYDSHKARVMSHVTPLRTAGGGHRALPGYKEPCDRGGMYPDYEYSAPGEASPYSVSSELYKHVMPQYFHFSRPASRGSVLV